MATLNKSDLVGEVSQESGLSNDDAKLAIEKLFELIARLLVDGDEVNVPGFGKFTVTERAARQGRNPQTGFTGGSSGLSFCRVEMCGQGFRGWQATLRRTTRMAKPRRRSLRRVRCCWGDVACAARRVRRDRRGGPSQGRLFATAGPLCPLWPI